MNTDVCRKTDLKPPVPNPHPNRVSAPMRHALTSFQPYVWSLWFSLLAITGCDHPQADPTPSPEPTTPVENPPHWYPLDTEVYFGEVAVGDDVWGSLDIQNTGATALKVQMVLTDDANDMFALNEVANFEVAPGLVYVVAPEFAPSALGEVTGTLHFSTNDPDNSEVDVYLKGTGTEPAAE